MAKILVLLAVSCTFAVPSGSTLLALLELLSPPFPLQPAKPPKLLPPPLSLQPTDLFMVLFECPESILVDALKVNQSLKELTIIIYTITTDTLHQLCIR